MWVEPRYRPLVLVENTRNVGAVFTDMREETPKSIRVRTGEENEYRYHAVQQAADFYGCNRSDAIAYACDNVISLVEAAETILSRDDLTPKQKKEIAEEFSGRGLDFGVEELVSVSLGDD